MAYFIQLFQLVLVLVNSEFYPKNISEIEKKGFSEDLRHTMIGKIRVWADENVELIIIDDKQVDEMKQLDDKLRREIAEAER